MQDDTRFRALGGRDAYEVLGVAPGATADEIIEARRRLQRAVHPDLLGDAESSKLVNCAADILLDPGLRRRYDELRAGGAAGYAVPGGPPGPAAGPFAGPPPPPPPVFPAPARQPLLSARSIVLLVLLGVALVGCFACFASVYVRS